MESSSFSSCLEFYTTVLRSGARAELHLFSSGGHGFDLGQGRGKSAELWKESFVAWLMDSGFIAEAAAR